MDQTCKDGAPFPTFGSIEGATVRYHYIRREAICLPLASLAITSKNVCKYCNSYFKAIHSTVACKAASYASKLYCHKDACLHY